jgi:hypothetical protein
MCWCPYCAMRALSLLLSKIWEAVFHESSVRRIVMAITLFNYLRATVQCIVARGFEQLGACRLGGRELRFKAVAHCHQCVHPRDDATLFGERWERDWKRANVVEIEARFSCSVSSLHQFSTSSDWCHETKKEPPGQSSIGRFDQSDMLTHIRFTQYVVQQRRIRNTCPGDNDIGDRLWRPECGSPRFSSEG